MTRRVHACLECGELHGRKGEFCRDRCRSTWNNRRKQRGAELYDLYMAHRHDRKRAQELGVFQAINRLASEYRLDDLRDRAGRRSWRRPKEVLLDHPSLKTIVGYDGTGRGRAA